MKVLRAALALSFLGISSSFASVSLQFSSLSSGAATNWANSSGVVGLRLVWGIVIDAGNDGFDSTYFPSVNFATTGTGQPLSLPDGSASDDILVLSQVTMPLLPVETDGASIGMNLISTVNTIPIGPFGVGTGDLFEIVWFDRTTQSGLSVYGEDFGTFSHPNFLLPGDGATVNFFSVFAGPDQVKTMNNALVPEPTSAVLGMLGLGCLLRRRR